MSTMTMSSPAQASGSNYFENVVGATRALLAAIFAVPVQATAERQADDFSVARLYRLASSYDSVMPNLAQELRVIALRG